MKSLFNWSQKLKKNSLILGSLCLLAYSLVVLSSCQDDIIHEGNQVDLSFSLDTLRFDTVFTEVGTITRFFKIFNNEEGAVILDEIKLNNENESFFRLNADGIQGQIIENIRIEPNDSIYVFVEATIDPNQPLSFSPFVIEELVTVTDEDSSFEVHLEAWGQNANYVPNRFAAATINLFDCNGGSILWNDPKPYVIYGVLIVDNCQLNLAAGTEIYVHGGVAINDIGIYSDGILVITETGSLVAAGTPEDRVLIQSDRLEESFQDESGQWRGIVIQAGSRNNELTNVDIKHAILGVSVDSAATLNMNSVTIGYTSDSGLFASHADVSATNCLYFANGTNSVRLDFGGQYTFDYCTLANYNNQSSALSINNVRCSDPLCQEEIFIFPLNAEFNNCIVTGNEDDEIALLDFTDGELGFFNYQFNNSIVVVDELLETEAFPNFFNNCVDCKNITRSDTLFLNLEENDFHLDTMSIAIDMARPIGNINTDLEANPREPNLPDIGCYEHQK